MSCSGPSRWVYKRQSEWRSLCRYAQGQACIGDGGSQQYPTAAEPALPLACAHRLPAYTSTQCHLQKWDSARQWICRGLQVQNVTVYLKILWTDRGGEILLTFYLIHTCMYLYIDSVMSTRRSGGLRGVFQINGKQQTTHAAYKHFFYQIWKFHYNVKQAYGF